MSAETRLKTALEAAPVPLIDCCFGEVGRIMSVDTAGAALKVAAEAGLPVDGIRDELTTCFADIARAGGHDGELAIELTANITARGTQPNMQPLAGVRNIVAIASGKGGVGKSTTAVNLALALSAEGARVGVLDADIYGPSQPLMLGLTGERPVTEDGKTMIPPIAHGLQAMSIGFLIDADQPMAWRGPMVTSALTQLLQQSAWDDLDYLIVDMPPGTGDIQLTLSQRVPVSGAVIVTTPQDIALLDARKGLQMFRKVSVPVLGVIENMSTHVCSSCGHEESIFGSGGGASLSTDYDVELLGQLPLDRRIREQTDSGRPTVVAEPDGPLSMGYRVAALKTAAALARLGRNYGASFPKIVVEDS
ncbi:MAG: iron-sulfur cluster carrier protein ApbC [Pseudomonadota bacterium]